MKLLRRALPLALLLCSLASADDLDHEEAMALRQSGEIVALEQVLGEAMSRHPGARLLEVELEREHGQLIYEIELLTTAGVVRELTFDARSGQLTSDEVD